MAAGIREYETIVITKPDLDEHIASGLATKLEDIIKTNNGKILEVVEIGKKKLAYPIKKQPKGNYILYHYVGKSTTIKELERHMNISEDVLRFQTIKISDSFDPAKSVSSVTSVAKEISQQEE